MSASRFLIVTCLFGVICGPLVGCGKTKEDPTKLPTYKDATKPGNMPNIDPGGAGTASPRAT